MSSSCWYVWNDLILAEPVHTSGILLPWHSSRSKSPSSSQSCKMVCLSLHLMLQAQILRVNTDYFLSLREIDKNHFYSFRTKYCGQVCLKSTSVWLIFTDAEIQRFNWFSSWYSKMRSSLYSIFSSVPPHFISESGSVNLKVLYQNIFFF